jgi:trimeric autotransporter adhesin
VQNATGITVSLFQDFTKAAAPTDGSPDAKTVARMVVVTTQEQNKNLTGAVGSKAIDEQTISQQDLNKAIQKKLLEILPKLIEALTDPAYLAATTPKAKEAAIVAAVSSSLLTTASVPTFVAINNQAAATTVANTVTVAPITANASLANLNFTNATNWFVRTMGSSAAHNTPNATTGLVRYVERRLRSNNGVAAAWGMGTDPARNADLHWNGSAWTGCAINYENTSTLRDASGNSSYEYCDKLETGKSNRASFDVAGKTMLSVYNQIVNAGYTNIAITNAATVLGTTTFPAGSNLFYQTTTPLSEAISYYPGSGNIVKSYSPAVYAGGDTRSPSVSVGCSSVEFQSAPAIDTTTLEAMVAANPGTPCLFNTSTLTVSTVTYSSGDFPSEAWGNSSISIGTLGTVNSNGAPNAFYTGNTLIRLAFKGTGTNPVTYYACKQRFGGSPRSCRVIGSGNYSITTYGDGRAMTLTNPPIEAAPLTYNRVFVERAGKIYFGYQSKLNISNTARFNLTGVNALLTQLGMPVLNPATPLALTAASYQGIYDTTVPSLVGGNPQTITMNPDGSTTCFDKNSASSFSCSFSFIDAPAGTFTFNGINGVITNGTTNFMTGIVSGTLSDPSTSPSTIRPVSGTRR